MNAEAIRVGQLLGYPACCIVAFASGQSHGTPALNGYVPCDRCRDTPDATAILAAQERAATEWRQTYKPGQHNTPCPRCGNTLEWQEQHDAYYCATHQDAFDHTGYATMRVATAAWQHHQNPTIQR